MSERFAFSDLRELLAKANEEKSGDQLAGIAAASERERVAAKRKLADVVLNDFLSQPLVDDDVTRLLLDTFDDRAFQNVRRMTVGEFREYILDDETTESDLRALQWGILPEMAAAAAKIMSNKDLCSCLPRFGMSHAAGTPWVSGVCWGSVPSPIIRLTTWVE